MQDEKVISIEDRIPRLKKQRRKKVNRRLIFYLTLFFFLICIIAYLQSPLSNVRHIEVLGNEFIDDEEIIALSNLDINTNIWNVKVEEIEALIEENSFVKSVVVTRNLPSTITIEIEEYIVVGYVEYKDEFHPLLENGERIPLEDRYLQGDAPYLIDFTDESMLQTLAEHLSSLPNNIFRLISEVYWTPEAQNEYKVQLYMNDGFIVNGSLRNLSEKMEAYPSIVAQLDPEDKGIIHLNVGAYFESFSN